MVPSLDDKFCHASNSIAIVNTLLKRNFSFDVHIYIHNYVAVSVTLVIRLLLSLLLSL